MDWELGNGERGVSRVSGRVQGALSRIGDWIRLALKSAPKSILSKEKRANQLSGFGIC